MGIIIGLTVIAAICGGLLRFMLERENKHLARLENEDTELTDKDMKRLKKTAEIEGIDIAAARQVWMTVLVLRSYVLTIRSCRKGIGISFEGMQCKAVVGIYNSTYREVRKHRSIHCTSSDTGTLNSSQHAKLTGKQNTVTYRPPSMFKQ